MLTGFIVAIIVLGALSAWAATRNPASFDGRFDGPSTSFTTPVPPDQAFKVIEAVPPGQPLRLSGADPALRRIILAERLSISHFGYYHCVDFAPAADGQTLVTVGIKSMNPMQFGPFVRRQQEKDNQAMAKRLQDRLRRVRIG